MLLVLNKFASDIVAGQKPLSSYWESLPPRCTQRHEETSWYQMVVCTRPRRGGAQESKSPQDILDLSSSAEERDGHAQIPPHFDGSPPGWSHLLRLGFPTETSLTWKNSPLYFLKCALVNSSLLHLVSFLFSEPFLLSFSGASHNLILGDATRENANRITKCKQMLPGF